MMYKSQFRKMDPYGFVVQGHILCLKDRAKGTASGGKEREKGGRKGRKEREGKEKIIISITFHEHSERI